MQRRSVLALLAIVAAGLAAAPALARDDEEGSGKRTFELGDALGLAGHGRLHGSVDGNGQAVTIRARGGLLKVVDLSGDTEVVCRGHGRKHERDAEGHDVTICAGSGGAKITGGEFRLGLFAQRAFVHFPAEMEGTITVNGRWRVRGEEDGERQRPRRPHRPDLRPDRPAEAEELDGEDEESAEEALDEELEQVLGS